MKLRLHHFLKCSYANGPGTRAVIWTQGCPLHCPGCFNPETHSIRGGTETDVRQLADEILTLKQSIEGITISGGEPLAQAEAVAELLAIIRNESALSVILFTGYAWSELPALFARVHHSGTLLKFVDVLIAGRYDQTQHLASGLRGSSNKTLHFLTDRYTQADIESVPDAEIVLTADGTIVGTGILPLTLQTEATH